MARLVVDIGGSKTRAALWTAERNFIGLREQPTPLLSSADFVDQLALFLEPLKSLDHVEVISLASAGPLNFRAGILQAPANLGRGQHGWQDFPLRDLLEARMARPVLLENDAAMAAWGQYCHLEKRSCGNLVVVTLGTGLGVGALVEGQLVRAGQGRHPEVGHLINLPKTQGGVSVRAEHLLAAKPFAAEVGLIRKRKWQGKDLIQDAQAGEWSGWPRVWQDYVERMAHFVVNLHLIYAPEKIVFAGGFAHDAWSFFAKGLSQRVAELLRDNGLSAFPAAQLELSSEPDLLPLFGAAYWVAERGV